MKKIVQLLLITSAVISVGCSSAKKSSEVSAAYVPTSRYSSSSCDQLISEAEGLRRNTPALATAVDQHRSNQTGVEVVTWVLFFPAALMLDKGEKQSNDLAQAKGELEAIQLALQTRNCRAATPPAVTADATGAPAAPIQTASKQDASLKVPDATKQQSIEDRLTK